MDSVSKIDAVLEEFKDRSEELIKACNSFDKAIRAFGCENEQFFINFQDKLNEISVR